MARVQPVQGMQGCQHLPQQPSQKPVQDESADERKKTGHGVDATVQPRNRETRLGRADGERRQDTERYIGKLEDVYVSCPGTGGE